MAARSIGDAVMAIFGVPVLHEDDALRAVRAACEMRAALAPLNEELERDYGTTLSLRIGVNTGEVVTRTEERLATGDAVNVAARLEQAAQPGQILVGPATVELVRAIEIEPLGAEGQRRFGRAGQAAARRGHRPSISALIRSGRAGSSVTIVSTKLSALG